MLILMLTLAIVLILTVLCAILLYYMFESYSYFKKFKDPVYLLFSILFLIVCLILIVFSTTLVLNTSNPF